MVCTLIDHRNDVILCSKFGSGTTGTFFVFQLKVVEQPVTERDGRDRPDGSAKNTKRLTSKHTPVRRMDTVHIGPKQVTVKFSVSLAEGFKLTPDAPSIWQGSVYQGDYL